MIKKAVLIFILLSVIASALNYFAYPLFSRILSADEYVNITVSLSLFTQVAAFLSSILAITIGLTKSEPHESANKKIEALQSFLFKFFLLLAVVFLVLSPYIMDRINTPLLFAFPITLMMLFSIPISIISGYLNGKNQMIKLGIVTVVSAGSQFIVGLTMAYLTRSGLLTMLSMTIAQIIAITIIYRIFSKENLPGIISSLTNSPSFIDKHMKKLVIYTAVASVAIMVISLIQIYDLFIIQSLHNSDMKFYADIYVISRVVFFIGMIFIWPFLGEISFDHHHVNRKPFIKLLFYFCIITFVSIAILYLCGDRLAELLFGATYDIQRIRDVGILSVLYKFYMLIVTAVILYFIVLRSYIAAWLSGLISGAIFLFTVYISPDTSIVTVLEGLNVIALLFAAIGILLLFNKSIHSNEP